MKSVKIQLETRIRQIKAGVEARAPALRIVGHGPDTDGALESLKIAARAWCIGLQARQQLEGALTHEGIPWEDSVDEIEIHLRVTEPIGAYEP